MLPLRRIFRANIRAFGQWGKEDPRPTTRKVPLQKLPIHLRKLAEQILRGSPVNVVKNSQDLLALVSQIAPSSFTLKECVTMIEFMNCKEMRAINYYEVANLMFHLGVRVEDLFEFNPETMSKSQFQQMESVIIALVNSNIKLTRLMKKFLQCIQSPRIQEFFDLPEMRPSIPNVLWAFTKVPFEFTPDETAAFKTILVKYLDAAVGNPEEPLAKYQHMLGSLMLSEARQWFSEDRIRELMQELLVKSEREVLLFNNKFCYTFGPIFISLFPEAGLEIRHRDFLGEIGDPKNPHAALYPRLSVIMNTCLTLIRCLHKKSLPFEPSSFEMDGVSIVSQTPRVPRMKVTTEERVKNELISRGLPNVKALQVIGIQEIDLLLEDSIVVEIHGAHHFFTERVYRHNESAEQLRPLHRRTRALYSYEKIKLQNLKSYGIRHVIVIKTANIFHNNDEVFLKLLADEIQKRYEAYQDRLAQAAAEGVELPFTIDDTN